MNKVVRILPLIALLGTLAFAADKKAPNVGKVIDSGTFGIFVDGRRVGTEKFQIEQTADGSVARSELSAGDGDGKASQKSELQLTATGDLRKYTWNEMAPGTASATVEPQNQILYQKVMTSPTDEKPYSQPYILPANTVILDDYFFSQRELLLWRYLAGGCEQKQGQTECKLTKSQYAALIPRQRASLLVNVEFIGKEKVMVHGQAAELNRFNLQGEGMDWSLWLDDSYKVIRIVIGGDKTEVVRE